MQTKTKQYGFTLVELLVTLGIMMLLMGITIPFEVSYRNKAELKGSSKELRSLFWEAQNRALAPRSKNATAYRLNLQKTPEGVTIPITISLRECKGSLPTDCIPITDGQLPQAILGKNIIIESIKLDGIEASGLAQVDFAVGDNQKSGGISFIEGSSPVVKDKMEIVVGSKALPSIKYNITIDRKMESVTYLTTTE
jgi:Tfp pilus assembly major pilin PilA